MATVSTHYFDGSGGITNVNNSWTNPSNAFDDDFNTNALAPDIPASPPVESLIGVGTNAPVLPRTITEVKMLILGQTAILDTPSGGWTWEKLQGLTFSVEDSFSSGNYQYLFRAKDGSTTLATNSRTFSSSLSLSRIRIEVTSFLPEAYWVGGSSVWNTSFNWSTESGGVGGAGVPDENTDVIFDENSFSSDSNVNITTSSVTVKSLDCSAVDNLFSIGSNVHNRVLAVINDVTLSPNLFMNFQLQIAGDCSFNPNGVSNYNSPLAVAFGILSSGNVTLTGNLNAADRGIVNLGSFDSDGFSIQAGIIQSQGSSSSTDIKDSEITIGNYFGPESSSVWLHQGSFSQSGSKITIFRFEQTANFSGGGRTYNELVHEGSDNLTILGSNTFNTLKLDPGTTNTFASGTTQTITTLDAVGTEGNLITIKSSSTTQHNLLSPSGRQNCDYLDIQNSNAGGDTLWFAGSNSVDSGGN